MRVLALDPLEMCEERGIDGGFTGDEHGLGVPVVDAVRRHVAEARVAGDLVFGYAGDGCLCHQPGAQAVPGIWIHELIDTDTDGGQSPQWLPIRCPAP